MAHARQQGERHLFLVVGIAPDAAAGREVVAAVLDDDARPQHAGRVEQVEVAGQHDLLFDLGDAGLVAGFGRTLADERVDQRRLADVGNAADQHPHRLDHAPAQRRQIAAGGDQLPGRGSDARIERQRVRAGPGLVVGHPLRRAFRVGEVLLVQHLQRRLAQCQFGQQRVGAGPRQPRIEQLDHHIDVRQSLGNGLLGRVHVTRKPLDGHVSVLSAETPLGFAGRMDCRRTRLLQAAQSRSP